MRYISISYALHFYLICVTFLSHMRYISISYALHFYLICVMILSHMRYVCISYAIETRTACFNLSYTFRMVHLNKHPLIYIMYILSFASPKRLSGL